MVRKKTKYKLPEEPKILIRSILIHIYKKIGEDVFDRHDVFDVLPVKIRLNDISVRLNKMRRWGFIRKIKYYTCKKGHIYYAPLESKICKCGLPLELARKLNKYKITNYGKLKATEYSKSKTK